MFKIWILVGFVAKNGKIYFWSKNPNNFWSEHRIEAETDHKASRRRPLHIDIISSSGCPKMENFKKKRKLKNRHLIKIPFIISKFIKFIKLQTGSKILIFVLEEV